MYFDVLLIAFGIRLYVEKYKEKRKFSRHVFLNDFILKALSTSGFPPILKPSGLVHKDANRAHDDYKHLGRMRNAWFGMLHV